MHEIIVDSLITVSFNLFISNKYFLHTTFGWFRSLNLINELIFFDSKLNSWKKEDRPVHRIVIVIIAIIIIIDVQEHRRIKIQKQYASQSSKNPM